MALGPGKYDEITTEVRNTTEAHGVILIVVGGNLGSGFSVQTMDRRFAEMIPALLRNMAEQIENDVGQSGS